MNSDVKKNEMQVSTTMKTRIFEVVKPVRFRSSCDCDDVDETRDALAAGTLVTEIRRENEMIEAVSRDFGQGWLPLHDEHLRLKGSRGKAPGRPTQATQLVDALKSKLDKNEAAISSSLRWLKGIPSMIMKQPTTYTAKLFQRVANERDKALQRVKKSKLRSQFCISTGEIASFSEKISDRAILQCFDDLLDMYSLHHNDAMNTILFQARRDDEKSVQKELKRKEFELETSHRDEMTRLTLESRREFEEWKRAEFTAHETEMQEHLAMIKRRGEVAARIYDEMWSRDVEPRMRVRFEKQYQEREAAECETFLSKFQRQEHSRLNTMIESHELSVHETKRVAQNEARLLYGAERARVLEAKAKLRRTLETSKREEHRFGKDEVRTLRLERDALKARNENLIEERRRGFRRDIIRAERDAEQRAAAERVKVVTLLEQESLQYARACRDDLAREKQKWHRETGIIRRESMASIQQHVR